MSRHKIFGLACGLSLLGLGACNSTYEPGESIASSVAVYSFSVKSNGKDLADVDTVFFSVDLLNARIFNADSLPYGTRVSSLVPRVRTLDGVSVCEFHVKRPGKSDTIYNFITHPEDSIDFSNGPVTLRIVSPDASVERNYSVSVNVHKMKSDSLEWSLKSRTAIPTELTSPTGSGSAECGGKLYCLTTDASGRYSLGVTDDAFAGEWRFVSAPFAGMEAVEPSSLRGGERTLYILGKSGQLYTSADGGQNWADGGRRYLELYGELGGYPVGTAIGADGDYVLVNPSTGAEEALPGADFPVSGASAGVRFAFPMSSGEQMVILGGRTASGALSDAAWAFDGKSWLKLTGTMSLPAGMEGMTLVPYSTFDGDNAWDAQSYSSLLAFGGMDAAGVASRTVYVSRDYGMSWRKADKLLQLPDYFAAARGMQGFVITHLTKSSDAEAAMTKIFAPLSRATEPVTQWEVPYIYLIGGTTADGRLYPDMWRGVINRLSFKPLI